MFFSLVLFLFFFLANFAMSNTPNKQRSTRLNSNATQISLLDIKNLIENSKIEVLNRVKEDSDRLERLIVSLDRRLDKIEAGHSQLEAKCNYLEEKCNVMEKVIRTKDEIGSLKMTHPTNLSMDETVLKALEEIRQVEGRRKNLIISGAPTVSGSLHERTYADKLFLDRLHDQLNIGTPIIEDIRRLGRPDHQHLLKVRYFDVNDRDTVLKQARSLRHSSEFQKVYINPDLTPIQQRERYKLRQELQRRKEDGENVVIHRNRIINRNSTQNFH